MQNTFLFLFLFLLLAPDVGFGQSGGFAGSFARMGAHPASVAMGNAMVAYHSEFQSSYYNPALAAKSTNAQVILSSGILTFDRRLNTINASFRLPPQAGLGISFVHGGVRDIDGRSLSGFQTETLETNEFQIGVSFGINLSEKFSAGVAAKFSLSNLHNDISNATATGFDLGLLYQASPRLSLGVALQDLLAEFEWETGEFFDDETLAKRTNKFPTRLKGGASFQINPNIELVGEHEIRFQESDIIVRDVFTDFGRPDFRQGRETETTNAHITRLGGRWQAHERVTFRLGAEFEPEVNFTDSFRPSGGFSIHLPFDMGNPRIDYAVVREQANVGLMHFFSIALSL